MCILTETSISRYLCFGKKELRPFLILWVFLQLCTLNLPLLFTTLATSEIILFVDITLLYICHFNFLIDWCLLTFCVSYNCQKKNGNILFFLQCTCFYIRSLLHTFIKLDVFKSLCAIYMQHACNYRFINLKDFEWFSSMLSIKEAQMDENIMYWVTSTHF